MTLVAIVCCGGFFFVSMFDVRYATGYDCEPEWCDSTVNITCSSPTGPLEINDIGYFDGVYDQTGEQVPCPCADTAQLIQQLADAQTIIDAQAAAVAVALVYYKALVAANDENKAQAKKIEELQAQLDTVGTCTRTRRGQRRVTGPGTEHP